IESPKSTVLTCRASAKGRRRELSSDPGCRPLMSSHKEDRKRSSSHKAGHHRHGSGKRARTVQDACVQTDTRDSEAQTRLRFSKHKIEFNVDIGWEPHPLSGCPLVAGKYIVPETGWPPPQPQQAAPVPAAVPNDYYASAAAAMPEQWQQQQQLYQQQTATVQSGPLLLPPSQVFGSDGGMTATPVSAFPPVSMLPNPQPAQSAAATAPSAPAQPMVKEQPQEQQAPQYPPSNGPEKIDNTQWDNAGAAATWRAEQLAQQSQYAEDGTFVPSESLYSQESVQMQQNLADSMSDAAAAAAAAAASSTADINDLAGQASAATAAAAAAAAAAGAVPSAEEMQRYYSQYYDAYYRNWYTQNFNKVITEQHVQQQQAAAAVASPTEPQINLSSLNPESRSAIDEALNKLKAYFGSGATEAPSQPPPTMMPMTIDPSVAAAVSEANAAAAAPSGSDWQPYPEELKQRQSKKAVQLIVPPSREELELHSSNPQRKLAWKPPPQPPPEILSDKQDAINRLSEELRRKKASIEEAENDILLRLKLSYAELLNKAVSKVLSLNVQYVFGTLADLSPLEQGYYDRPPINYRLHLCDILIANVFITQGGADWKNGSQEAAARQAFKLLMRPCHVVGSSRRWLGTEYLVLCLSEKNTLIPDLPPYLSDPNEPLWMKNKPLSRKDPADSSSRDAVPMDEERFESRNVKPLRELWLLTEGAPETPHQIMNPVRFLYNSGRFSNMLISFEFEVLSNGLFNCALFVDRQFAGYGYGSTIDKARGFAARNATNNLFHRQMRVAVDVSGSREPLDPSVLWDQEVDATHYLLYLKMQRLTEFREKTMRQDFMQLLTHYVKNTPDFLEPLKFHQRDFEPKWPMFIECACELGLFYRIVGNTDKFRQLLICKKLPLMQLREVLLNDGRCGRYWVVSKGTEEAVDSASFERPPALASEYRAQAEQSPEAAESAEPSAAEASSAATNATEAAKPAEPAAPEPGSPKLKAAANAEAKSGMKAEAAQVGSKPRLAMPQRHPSAPPEREPSAKQVQPLLRMPPPPPQLMRGQGMLPGPMSPALSPHFGQPQSLLSGPLLQPQQRVSSRPGPVPFSRFAATATFGGGGMSGIGAGVIGGAGARQNFPNGPPRPLFPFPPRRP
ncbi:hypothetical protein BOX15_Mlig031294g1, partial [Macrostomum lignano]